METTLGLNALMTEETIPNVPIHILGNKNDKADAISEEKLHEIFGLYGLTTGKENVTLRELNACPKGVLLAVRWRSKAMTKASTGFPSKLIDVWTVKQKSFILDWS